LPTIKYSLDTSGIRTRIVRVPRKQVATMLTAFTTLDL